MTEAERALWLEDRKKSIGGSDAAAIIGLSKYATPYTVWADKTGKLPPQEDNEAMRQGRDLEDYVAKRFCEETGKRVKRHNQIIRNDKYPFAHATIDRKVIGEDAGLECKTTTTLNLKQFKNGEYPDNYYVQCVHYMAVTGLKRWYLAVLVLGKGFFVYTIERDEDEINALMNAESDFWNKYVVTDLPPPADGLAPTSSAINKCFPTSVDETIDLSHMHNNFRKLEEINKQISLLTAARNECIQTIKVEMADCGTGQCGDYTANWKGQTRFVISKSLLQQHYPEVDINKVIKIAKFRRFTVKKELN